MSSNKLKTINSKTTYFSFVLLAFTVASMSILTTGCTEPDDISNKTNNNVEISKPKNEEEKNMEFNQFDLPKEGETVATIKTNKGDIKIRLFNKQAPKAVENFVKHAKDGYYNNVIFHRVIDDFMIQSGDPTGTGRGGESIWNKPFEDELSDEVLPYRGALAMANSGPNTNGSQFFIVQAEKVDPVLIGQMESSGIPQSIINGYKQHGGTPHLDFRFSQYSHTVFGQVYSGLDVVDAIAKVERDKDDKPLVDVVIKEILIEEIPQQEVNN